LPIRTITLPSPSPAYASMRYEEKREIYRAVLQVDTELRGHRAVG